MNPTVLKAREARIVHFSTSPETPISLQIPSAATGGTNQGINCQRISLISANPSNGKDFRFK
jgi:hypothetical protein